MSASIQLADEETGEIPEPIVCAVNPNESMFLVVFFPGQSLSPVSRPRNRGNPSEIQDYAELM